MSQIDSCDGMKMRAFKYLIILVLALVACKQRQPIHAKSSLAKKDTLRFAKYPWVGQENNIQELVAQLETSECLVTGRTGFIGEENIYDDCYERLLEIATDSSWIRLTSSKRPVVRMYAFLAIYNKNKIEGERIKHRMKRDTAVVRWISADNELDLPIGVLISAITRRSGEVEISADKKVYGPNDTITLKITNKSSIQYWHSISLEMKISKGWVEVEPDILGKNLKGEHYTKLEGNQTIFRKIVLKKYITDGVMDNNASVRFTAKYEISINGKKTAVYTEPITFQR